MHEPQVPRALQFFRVADPKGALGKKGGVCVVTKWDVKGSDRQREVGCIGVNAEVVDARDFLVSEYRVAMRSFRQNSATVCENIQAGSRRANRHVCILRYGKFDQQGNRTVIGCKLQMNAEPGERPFVARGQVVGGVHRFARWASSRMILVRYVGNDPFRVAHVPCGVIEIRRLRRRIGGHSNAPILVEDKWRAKVGCIQRNVRNTRAIGRGRSGMTMRSQDLAQRAWGFLRRLGTDLHRSAHDQNGHRQKSPAHVSSPFSMRTPL